MSQTPKKVFNWALFNQLAKTLVIIAIVGLGVQPFYVFWSAGQRSEIGERIEDQNLAVDLGTDPNQIFADFTSGAWRFGESDWDFRILSSAAVSAASSLPTAIRKRDPGFDDESVIAQFRELDVKPQSVGKGFERWESQGMGCTMTLFTHDGVVQMMRTQLPVEQGISIIEAFPKSGRIGDSNAILLPLIDEAKQTAIRIDPNGRVTSAIIYLNAEKQIDIRSHWKEDGWKVTSTAEPGSDELIRPLANSKFRCSKGSTEIEATFISENDDPQAVIILNLLLQPRESAED
jgi:hypothetical protein